MLGLVHQRDHYVELAERRSTEYSTALQRVIPPPRSIFPVHHR
jgi:hypothetical protein